MSEDIFTNNILTYNSLHQSIFEHITTAFQTLQWLPVARGCLFKAFCTVHKANSGTGVITIQLKLGTSC